MKRIIYIVLCALAVSSLYSCESEEQRSERMRKEVAKDIENARRKHQEALDKESKDIDRAIEIYNSKKSR